MKVINIEALTMLDMARKDILPAVSGYCGELSQTIAAKHSIGGIDSSYELETVRELSSLLAKAHRQVGILDVALSVVRGDTSLERARYYRDNVLAAMNELRHTVDAMELRTSAKRWPYPSYGELLFSVK